MYAVYDRMRERITFAGKIAPGYRGHWRDGVTLAPLPHGLDRWPEGHGWPDRTVGVSVGDGNHYRVFTYASELAGSGYRSTGMSYGGAFEIFPTPF